MLTMPRIFSLSAACLLIAGSALAQSTATSANTTMGTNPNPPGSAGGSTQSSTTAPGNMSSGKAGEAEHHHHRSHARAGTGKRIIWTDTTRLEALLTDAQTNVSVSADAWKKVGNEAGVLANRIYSHASGNAESRPVARDLRKHVREMQAAAMTGDAAGVRTHAGMALPYAYKLVDWSTPAGNSSGM
jgi:hypothetical protein